MQPLPAAVARRARRLVAARPGQRVVAPLAGDGVGPDQHAAVDHDAAAGAGADDHAEHHAGAGRRAVGRLRQREAVGVVGDPHRSRRARCADRRRRARPISHVELAFLTSPVAGEIVPGMPMPTDASRAALALDRLHETGDRRHRGRVVAARCRNPLPGQFASIVGNRNPLDLRAAQVDANPHGCGHRIPHIADRWLTARRRWRRSRRAAGHRTCWGRFLLHAERSARRVVPRGR